MIRVEVYGRAGCSLCDDAKDALRGLQGELPFELVDVDIALEPAVERKYRNDIPVVFVDGRQVFRHRVDVAKARRHIERAIGSVEGSELGAAALVPGHVPRGAKVAFLVAALLGVSGVLISKGYEVFVAQPRLAEDSFDIQRANVAAPDVPLIGRDGKRFSLSQHKGEVLFVNFWATWCPPCREEMPSMLQLGRELARAHPGKFQMVAVSGDSGWPEIDDYFRQTFGGTPQDLTVALDPEGKVARAYYCTARGVCPDIKFPETYIVDKSGRLVAYIVNSRDWTDPAARRFLERLIEG